MSQKKLFQEFFRYMLQKPCEFSPSAERLKEKLGVEGLEKMSVAGAIGLAMIDKAIGGDVAAATWIRDTAGERPSEGQQALLGCGEIRIFVQNNEQKIEIPNNIKDLSKLPDK